MQKDENGLYILETGEIIKISTRFGIITIINEEHETRIVAQGRSKEVQYENHTTVLPAVNLTEDTDERDLTSLIRRIKITPLTD